jgi:hypothetical protein
VFDFLRGTSIQPGMDREKIDAVFAVALDDLENGPIKKARSKGRPDKKDIGPDLLSCFPAAA